MRIHTGFVAPELCDKGLKAVNYPNMMRFRQEDEAWDAA